MAKELYSTLSRTIHNFQPSKVFDQYTLVPSQFDPMQTDFMAAMAPLKKNRNRIGDPNWEKERKRYPKQVVSTERAEKKARSKRKRPKEPPLLPTGSYSHPHRSSSNQSIKSQSDSEREEDGESLESEEDQANSGTKDISFSRSGKEEEGP
ncbi:MAG: hypothetical protein LQ342_007642 [Letrouitia transgressa]|nr:MAG: hypothetical protein LQ342_007642 [Letrouitia transgressa]